MWGLTGRLYKFVRGFEFYNVHTDVHPRLFYCAVTVSVNGREGGAWPQMRRTFRGRTRESAEAKAERWIEDLKQRSESDRNPVRV